MEDYLEQREVQTPEKNVPLAGKQNERDKWHKRVKSLLKSESFVRAVNFWSQSSLNKPALDSGISSSECSLTSLATRTSQSVNDFGGHGECNKTTEIHKTRTSDSPTTNCPILDNLRLLCKGIRNVGKGLAESPKNAPTQSRSCIYLSSPKIDYNMEVQRAMLEPILKSITVQPKEKYVNLKRKAIVAEYNVPKITNDEASLESKVSDSNVSDENECKIFEVESIRMFATQSTQTSGSRSSSTSSIPEKRLKFRARILVCPEHSKFLKIDSKNAAALEPKNDVSIKSRSTCSGSPSRSKKVRTSISCSKLNRCQPSCFRISSTRERPSYFKWTTKRYNKQESSDIFQKSSERSITPLNSGSVSVRRKKRTPTSNIESKAMKMKLGAINMTEKSNKSIEALQKHKKNRSLKRQSEKQMSLLSPAKESAHSTRQKPKKFIKELNGEPFCSKYRDSQSNSKRNGRDARGKKKQSSYSKLRKPLSPMHIRKQLIRLSQIYSGSAEPQPSSPKKSDLQSAWDVSMKVDNLLHCHRKFMEWQCSKISETCQNLLAKSKPVTNLNKDVDLNMLREGEEKNNQFEDSSSKMKKILRRFLENAEKKCIEDEKTSTEDNCEEMEGKQCTLHGKELSQQDSSPQTCKLISTDKRLPQTEHTIVIKVVAGKGTGEHVKELEKKPSIHLNEPLHISASEDWASEAPKLTDDDSQRPIENTSGISEQITEEITTPVGSTSNTPSTVSQSSVAAERRRDSLEQMLAKSYTDLTSCSSKDISIEKLKSAKVFLNHFLSKYPKIHSQVAKLGNIKGNEGNSLSEIAAALSPSRRTPSPSPFRWTSPSPTCIRRHSLSSSSSHDKRRKSNSQCPLLKGGRALRPSARFNLLPRDSLDKLYSKSHNLYSRDGKSQHHSRRDSALDKNALKREMDLLRIKDMSPRLSKVRHSVFYSKTDMCNNKKIRSRTREESIARLLGLNRSREETLTNSRKRNHSEMSGEQRRSSRDKKPESRYCDKGLDRQVHQKSRRQPRDSSQDTTPGRHSRTSRVSPRQKYAPWGVERASGRGRAKQFRPEVRAHESSTSGPSGCERPSARTARGSRLRPTRSKRKSLDEISKRCQDFLKAVIKRIYASEIPYDPLQLKSKLPLQNSKDKQISSKILEAWQECQGARKETKRLKKKELTALGKDATESTSVDGVPPFCDLRRPGLE